MNRLILRRATRMRIPEHDYEQLDPYNAQPHPIRKFVLKKRKYFGWQLKVLIYVLVVLGIALISIAFTYNETYEITAPISAFLQRSLNNLEKPENYTDTPYYVDDLPFCILINPYIYPQMHKEILDSLEKQPHRRFIAIKLKYPSLKSFSETIKDNCGYRDVLIFANSVFKYNALSQLNQKYQRVQIWSTFSKRIPSNYKNLESIETISNAYYNYFYKYNYNKKGTIQIDSINNDFQHSHTKLLYQSLNYGHNRALFVIAVLYLCRFHTLNFHLYKNNEGTLKNPLFTGIYFTLTGYKITSPSQPQNRSFYQPLFSLAQYQKIYPLPQIKRYKNYKKSSTTLKLMDVFRRMPNYYDKKSMNFIIYLEQLNYLPLEHSVRTVEQGKYQEKYGKYEEKYRLCVTVLTHNNAQHNRYKKPLLSLSSQKYKNYHIVFIDDASTDHTLELSSSFLHQLSFDSGQVTIVRNKGQKLATYNYLNAGFNFCKYDYIQVIIDGDDYLIGSYALSLVNAAYQRGKALLAYLQNNPNKNTNNYGQKSEYYNQGDIWVMNSFYKDDKYQYGFNLGYSKGIFGGRKFGFYFSPIRTWRVKLFRKLPTSYHIMPFSDNFFDTMADAAVQYGLFEMAGEKHSAFIPEINYLYTSYYTGSDNSNFYKSLRRDLLHFVVSLRNPLPYISSLDDDRFPINSYLQEKLYKDKGVEFYVIPF